LFLYVSTKDMHADGSLPDLAIIEQGRKNQATYTMYCSRFVQGVIGHTAFKTGCVTMKLSEYCSASDEAMTFLILANNWQPWSKMAELRKEDSKAKLEECGVKQMYFKETKGRGHSWSNEGKMYYNEMYDKVLADREVNGERFDEHFLHYMKNNSEEGKRLEKHKKKVRVDTTPVIRCKRDLPPMWMGARISNSDEYSYRNENMNANESVSGYSDVGIKKHRREQTEEETASEQARRLGATNHQLM
jgi:hypothetical protein